MDKDKLVPQKHGGSMMPTPKKGEVRNPYGRPGKDGKQGKYNVDTRIRQALNSVINHKDLNGTAQELSIMDSMIMEALRTALTSKSEEAKLRAFNTLLDRGYGKALQRTETKSVTMTLAEALAEYNNQPEIVDNEDNE